jgi:hypothetical protein
MGIGSSLAAGKVHADLIVQANIQQNGRPPSPGVLLQHAPVVVAKDSTCSTQK